ncbi:MAG: hypothetical protein ACJA0Q_000106 [Saprospiraceae bacterium]|jgi:hypothetical protein
MVKKLLFFISISLLVVSCGGPSESPANKVTASLDVNDLVESQSEFIQCKNETTENHACKSYVAIAFAKYYGYEMKGDGGLFLPYDEILDFVKVSSDWTEIGLASDQSVLIEAQENANNGIGTVALNTKGSKTVAIVIEGKLSHSNSLGLDCPNVVVFRPSKFDKSFVGKGINYAWSDLSNVKIYSLNK